MAVILRTLAIMSGSAFPEPGLTQLWWNPGTVGGSTADATDCLARFRASWNAFVGRMTTSVRLDFDPVCIAVNDSTGVLTGAFTGTTPGSVTGTVATDGLPRQTQGLCRLGTSSVVNGRRLRGRLFLPNPAEADNDFAGAPSSAYTSAVATSFGSILSPGATASAPVVWHRPQGGAGGVSALITSVGAAPTWSVLRSRR